MCCSGVLAAVWWPSISTGAAGEVAIFHTVMSSIWFCCGLFGAVCEHSAGLVFNRCCLTHLHDGQTASQIPLSVNKLPVARVFVDARWLLPDFTSVADLLAVIGLLGGLLESQLGKG